MRISKKKPPEQVGSGYVALPFSVLDSPEYLSMRDRAKVMMIDLARQHNGRNNGHLHLAAGWLRKTRHWTSVDSIQKAKAELLGSKLAIKTRLGGLNIGPDRYALTWLDISNFSGLTEVSPSSYHRGAYLLKRVVEKHKGRSVRRIRSVPASGAERPATAPTHGTKNGVIRFTAVPFHGNNVSCQFPPRKLVQREAVRYATFVSPERLKSFRAMREDRATAAVG
jgi:hypothetical protein